MSAPLCVRHERAALMQLQPTPYAGKLQAGAVLRGRTLVAKQERPVDLLDILVVNNTSGTASLTAVDIASFTSKASPAATDLIVISDQAASWRPEESDSLLDRLCRLGFIDRRQHGRIHARLWPDQCDQ
jgi:hypothetical protein